MRLQSLFGFCFNKSISTFGKKGITLDADASWQRQFEHMRNCASILLLPFTIPHSTDMTHAKRRREKRGIEMEGERNEQIGTRMEKSDDSGKR